MADSFRYPQDVLWTQRDKTETDDARAKAKAYAEKRMQEQRDAIAASGKYPGDFKPSPNVYYRVYEFETDKEGRPLDWRSMYA